jgi:hypothetical protein
VKPPWREFLHELDLLPVQAREAQQQLDRLGDRELSGDSVPFRMSVLHGDLHNYLG